MNVWWGLVWELFLYVNVSDQALCAENKSCKIDAISPVIEYYDPVKDKQTEDSNKNEPINETSEIVLHKDKLEVNPGK